MEKEPKMEASISTDEINKLLERLKFLEEETTKVVNRNGGKHSEGFEAWAVGKIMANDLSNREAMYRVF
ncbi:hypothetical protein J1N35_011605 [Gossypium stocksii]|uniref:Uncharacterized protein n=1 Tax=Gossypium stocksii TaxID=47602 RepID=A0A9D3W3Y6_9ROSI|nr:hypothetical protein J1N35_011605 [Gossypium stocksii]